MSLLKPMKPGGFRVYVERLSREYAEDKIAAGAWPAGGAIERARASIHALLPDGLNTPGHALFDVQSPDGAEPCGVLWLAVVQQEGVRRGFVYDLWIDPEHRRKGLGTLAMREAEAWTRHQGLSRLSLHVFGQNLAAQGLYAKLGFQVTDVSMSKDLD